MIWYIVFLLFLKCLDATDYSIYVQAPKEIPPLILQKLIARYMKPLKDVYDIYQASVEMNIEIITPPTKKVLAGNGLIVPATTAEKYDKYSASELLRELLKKLAKRPLNTEKQLLSNLRDTDDPSKFIKSLLKPKNTNSTRNLKRFLKSTQVESTTSTTIATTKTTAKSTEARRYPTTYATTQDNIGRDSDKNIVYKEDLEKALNELEQKLKTTATTPSNSELINEAPNEEDKKNETASSDDNMVLEDLLKVLEMKFVTKDQSSLGCDQNKSTTHGSKLPGETKVNSDINSQLEEILKILHIGISVAANKESPTDKNVAWMKIKIPKNDSEH